MSHDSDETVTVLPPVPLLLKERGIDLRKETPEDLQFLRSLYIAGRQDELSQVNWPESTKIAFLSQQFELQTQYYKSNYRGAAWGIITKESYPIGRLYIHANTKDIRIIDISIMSDFRNQGIGNEIIRSIFSLATVAKIGVSIHVDLFNSSAKRLYDRLGFILTGTSGHYHRMEWTPHPHINTTPK